MLLLMCFATISLRAFFDFLYLLGLLTFYVFFALCFANGYLACRCIAGYNSRNNEISNKKKVKGRKESQHCNDRLLLKHSYRLRAESPTIHQHRGNTPGMQYPIKIARSEQLANKGLHFCLYIGGRLQEPPLQNINIQLFMQNQLQKRFSHTIIPI